jgi:transposase
MRSPKKKPFSESRKHSKYKVTNWSEYNNILRNRGRIDFMIAENLANSWYEDSSNNRKPGRQRIYSDIAILQCLQIRYLFGLKLRQAQGFIDWIFKIAGFDLKCPDYTTLSIRAKRLDITILNKNYDKEFSHIIMDSTGIQTYTGNEWLENKHGKQYIRRIWKKLHIAVDEDGQIIANSMTDHNEDDRSQIEYLLTNIKTKELLGDPGYDGEVIYQWLRNQNVKPTIRPPNINFEIKKKDFETERDQNVSYQQTKGYQAWRVKNNYGRREKVENTFFRFKNAFGSKFLSRDDKNMKNELNIKCQLLNKMFEIGKPISTSIF